MIMYISRHDVVVIVDIPENPEKVPVTPIHFGKSNER